MLSKYGNCTRLLKIKNKLKVGNNSRYFLGVFNETSIPLALVGYAPRWLFTISYPTRTREITAVNYIDGE